MVRIDKEKSPPVVYTKKYKDVDFKRYKEARDKLKDEAKEMGFHPDILYQRDQGYLKLERRGTHPVTKKTIYEICAVVVLGDDDKLIEDKSTEHNNFLREFDLWIMRQGGKDKVITKSLEKMAEEMTVPEVEYPDEEREELLVNWNQ